MEEKQLQMLLVIKIHQPEMKIQQIMRSIIMEEKRLQVLVIKILMI